MERKICHCRCQLPGQRKLRRARDSRSTPMHGSAAIDKDLHVEILLLLVELRHQALDAPVDAPVDPPRVVTGRIIAKICELEAATRPARASLGAQRAPKSFANLKPHALKPGEKVRVEEVFFPGRHRPQISCPGYFFHPMRRHRRKACSPLRQRPGRAASYQWRLNVR